MSALLFTSGTAGVSKGVMLSHHNICFNLEEMCRMLYIGPEDVFLSVLPLHHAYECTCGFLCQIYRGTTVAFCEGLRYISRNMKEVCPTQNLLRAAFGGVTVQQNLGEHPQEGDGEEGQNRNQVVKPAAQRGH